MPETVERPAGLCSSDHRLRDASVCRAIIINQRHHVKSSSGHCQMHIAASLKRRRQKGDAFATAYSLPELQQADVKTCFLRSRIPPALCENNATATGRDYLLQDLGEWADDLRDFFIAQNYKRAVTGSRRKGTCMTARLSNLKSVNCLAPASLLVLPLSPPFRPFDSSGRSLGESLKPLLTEKSGRDKDDNNS